MRVQRRTQPRLGYLRKATVRLCQAFDARAVLTEHPCSFMPTSLTVSLILIVLELYVLLRLLVGLSLPSGLLDIRVSRAAALFVFDLAVLVPDAVECNVLGDFIPFSVGAVIVLGTPNFQLYLLYARMISSKTI